MIEDNQTPFFSGFEPKENKDTVLPMPEEPTKKQRREVHIVSNEIIDDSPDPDCPYCFGSNPNCPRCVKKRRTA